MIIKCHFDGATEKSNPSYAIGYGSTMTLNGELWRESCDGRRFKTKTGSSNQSEYFAVIEVLEYLENNADGAIVHLYGDSKLIVNQLNGDWKINEGKIKKLALEARKLLHLVKKKNKVDVSWVPREENGRADELSKQGLKQKMIKYFL